MLILLFFSVNILTSSHASTGSKRLAATLQFLWNHILNKTYAKTWSQSKYYSRSFPGIEVVRNIHHTLNQMSEDKGKGETWGAMNCSSLTVQVQQITCTGWNTAPSPCPSVLPHGGLGSPPCSIMELTVGSCTPCSPEMNDFSHALLTKKHLIKHLILVKLVPHESVAK